jgi:hypothetical protein
MLYYCLLAVTLPNVSKIRRSVDISSVCSPSDDFHGEQNASPVLNYPGGWQSNIKFMYQPAMRLPRAQRPAGKAQPPGWKTLAWTARGAACIRNGRKYTPRLNRFLFALLHLYLSTSLPFANSSILRQITPFRTFVRQ